MAAPSNRLETDFTASLSEQEIRQRTVSADEAFWTQDPEIVLKWAQENQYEPGNDWGVILSGVLALEDIVDLAMNASTVDAWGDYFIACAYIHVGDVQLARQRSGEHDQVTKSLALIDQHLASRSTLVATWAARAKAFLLQPEPDPALAAMFTWQPDEEEDNDANDDSNDANRDGKDTENGKDTEDG